jgi:hypothetical protein
MLTLMDLGIVMFYACPLFAAAHIYVFILARKAFFRGEFSARSSPRWLRARARAYLLFFVLTIATIIVGRTKLQQPWPDRRADLGGIMLGLGAGLGVLFFSAAVRHHRRSPTPSRRLVVWLSGVAAFALGMRGFFAAGVLVSNLSDYEHLDVTNHTTVKIDMYEGGGSIEDVSPNQITPIAPGAMVHIAYGGTCYGYCGWFTTRRGRFQRDFTKGISLVSASGRSVHLSLRALELLVHEVGPASYRLEVVASLFGEGGVE